MRLSSTNMQARKMLFVAILSICASSSKKISIYNEEMIVARCFLGSEGTAIHITGKLIILFGIILFLCIFKFRRYSSRMTKTNKYVRLIFYISILFSIYIFYYFLRIYLFSGLGLFFFY